MQPGSLEKDNFKMLQYTLKATPDLVEEVQNNNR